ncbi:hypothetical protein [Marinomonas atlantica]|uniref:hypothetical protein n=1 Tax=Marinomonas atlantica TaxID=1806668 RepID=UPI00082C01FF|nr:hypothetical protein [Marinomonas atlantica]
MPISPNRDQEIMSFEAVQAELDQSMQCMSCDWVGKRLDLIVCTDVKDDMQRCPDCQSAFVLLESEGQEINASYREWIAEIESFSDGDSLEIDDDVQIPF